HTTTGEERRLLYENEDLLSFTYTAGLAAVLARAGYVACAGLAAFRLAGMRVEALHLSGQVHPFAGVAELAEVFAFLLGLGTFGPAAVPAVVLALIAAALGGCGGARA